MGSFYYPPPRFLRGVLPLEFASPRANMLGVTQGLQQVVDLGVIVARIQTQPLRGGHGWQWSGHHDGLERVGRQLVVRTVRTRHRNRQRNAVPIGQQAAFGATLGPIRRIRSAFFPRPEGPSSRRHPELATAN